MNDWFTLTLLGLFAFVIGMLLFIQLKEWRLIKYCEQIIKKNSLTFYKAFFAN